MMPACEYAVENGCCLDFDRCHGCVKRRGWVDERQGNVAKVRKLNVVASPPWECDKCDDKAGLACSLPTYL